MIRENFDLEGESQHRIIGELQKRKVYMHSIVTYKMALLFVKSRNKYLTTNELQEKLGMSRPALLSAIGNLRFIHGFKIENHGGKGKPALYKMIGFEEPKGRKETIRRKKRKKMIAMSKLPNAKPETYNALINKVFR